MTPAEKLQLKNRALTVLHAPGGPLSGDGFSGKGGILEMTVVFDCSLPAERAADAGKEIIGTLRQADQIFRNVRVNTVWWVSDETIRREVTAAAILQLGRCFETYERREERKRLEVLAAYLKKYDARSRLLILVSGGGWRVEDRAALEQSLHPFLYRRILVAEPGLVRTGRQLLD